VEGQDVRKRATKQEVLFSPVPPESHIESLLYQGDGTGVQGKPTGYHTPGARSTCQSPYGRNHGLSRSVSQLDPRLLARLTLLLKPTSYVFIHHGRLFWW
jgi:hypothetical protein